MAAPVAYGGFQARGLIGALAAGLHQSRSNTRSEPSLRPIPQLTTMPDPQLTEQGQGLNLKPLGSQSDSLTTEPWRELQSFLLLLRFILFFLKDHTHGIWKFPGQELNLNHSCNLWRSCSKQDPLTHWNRSCISSATQAAAVGFLTHWAIAGAPALMFIYVCFWLNNLRSSQYISTFSTVYFRKCRYNN